MSETTHAHEIEQEAEPVRVDLSDLGDVEVRVRGWERVYRLRLLRDILMVFVVLCSLFALGFVFWDKQDDQDAFLEVADSLSATIRESARTIHRLEEDVERLRAENVEARTEEQLADDCVDFAAASYDESVGNLLVTLAQNPPGTPGREDLIAVDTAKIGAAKDYLHLVLNTRPRPVDCPPPIDN